MTVWKNGVLLLLVVLLPLLVVLFLLVVLHLHGQWSSTPYLKFVIFFTRANFWKIKLTPKFTQ